MPRRERRRERYMRDRKERKMMRGRDYGYPMDYRGTDREYGTRYDSRMGRDRHYPEEYYMGNEQRREYDRPYEYDMTYDMRYDYRGGDYRRGMRDYADDDYDKEYHEDLEEWTEKLKKYDRFGLSKDQVMQKARDMGVKFEDYEPDEFYAIYLMHVSDYPNISNDPHTYLAMTKSWLEDKDLKIDASEKVCKYMYEIAMADDED